MIDKTFIDWHPIATAPEGDHILLYFPDGENGCGGIECATIYKCKGNNWTSSEFSYWTHGGPNNGSDWEPQDSENPTHWARLHPPK